MPVFIASRSKHPAYKKKSNSDNRDDYYYSHINLLSKEY